MFVKEMCSSHKRLPSSSMSSSCRWGSLAQWTKDLSIEYNTMKSNPVEWEPGFCFLDTCFFYSTVPILKYSCMHSSIRGYHFHLSSAPAFISTHAYEHSGHVWLTMCDCFGCAYVFKGVLHANVCMYMRMCICISVYVSMFWMRQGKNSSWDPTMCLELSQNFSLIITLNQYAF